MNFEWQDRVITEKHELEARYHRLRDFTTTPEYYALDEADKTLLGRQCAAMALYLDLLNQRIRRFK